MVLEKTLEKQPAILSLPHDIIHKILLKTGEVSHYQFRRTKKACHRFRDVMEEEWYNRELDLWEMETRNWPSHEYEDLKDLCLQLQNPSAMYITGIDYLFTNGSREEGLDLIRQASVQGYDLAIYANACLTRIIHPTDRMNDKITREFVNEVKIKLFKDTGIAWNNESRQWLIDMQAIIDVKSIEKCNCIPNSNWHLPFKGPGACDQCFWKGETWCFVEKLAKGRKIWP